MWFYMIFERRPELCMDIQLAQLQHFLGVCVTIIIRVVSFRVLESLHHFANFHTFSTNGRASFGQGPTRPQTFPKVVLGYEDDIVIID